MNHEVSRRGFLAVGAAGVLAASTSLRAADEQPSASGSSKKPATLHWGVIGTGTRGRGIHIPTIKDAPESELVAVCDVAPERLQAAVTEAGKPVNSYSDYQKLLADPNVNAVTIVAPNMFHREMLLAALQAGKHVFCEKPAGVTPADATAMKQAVESAKTVVGFGMQYRHFEQPQQIKQVVASGRIGKPRYMIQNVSRGDWNLSPSVWQFADPKLAGGRPRNWRFSHTASGGMLNEFSCHYFDILHWLAGGLPQRITAEGGISVYKDGRDTWDHATVTMSYPDDLTAIHTVCLFGPGRNETTVIGDEGWLETVPTGLRVTNKRAKGKDRTQEIRPTGPEHGGDHRATLALYEDFVSCVKSGKSPDAGIDRAAAASRTCWLSELSAERKSEVKWGEVG